MSLQRTWDADAPALDPAGFARVCQFPESSPFYSPPFRRMKAKSFPYGFFYTVNGDDIVVEAVVHLRRSPVNIRARLRLS